MSTATAQATSATTINGQPGRNLPVGWVAGDQLEASPRTLNRLYHALAPTFARKIGRVYFFAPHAPAIARQLARANTDRSHEDLSGFSQKQIDQGRRWVKIIRQSRIDIARKMATSAMRRTQAVEWYCKVRCPELGFGGVPVGTFRRRSRDYDRAGRYKLLSQIDTRGRKTGAVVSCSPEAWAYFCNWYLNENRRTVQLCHELTDERAPRRGWSWPGIRTIQRKVREDIPEATRVLAREGEKVFQSKCVPRIHRSYAHVAAGDLWCADECTLDLYARAPDGKGGWKRVRPILTAWLDVRARMFVGSHIADRANSDTIVAAFKLAVREYGPPVEVICDNGEDYKSVGGGGRRRKWAAFDKARLGSIYSELDCTVHWATPYAPWAKMIESHFRAVHERHDKLWPSYCGNKPEHRPEGVEHVPVWKLPTVDEVRARFAEWLPAHHARPQTGDAMYNLSPAQAMDQFRSRTPRERPTADFLDFLCAKVVGPVKVTRDGVRCDGIRYGQGCDDLLRRQGQQVLLRVQPDRADFVDVTDLQGRPLVRATNDRLTGTTREDIRTAMSRRKRARKLAKEALAETPYVLRHSNVSAAIAAQRNRNRSEQTNTPPPEPPTAIKAVRPDLRADVTTMAAQQRLGGAQTAGKRRSTAVDFGAINAALGLGAEHGNLGESNRRATAANADAILASGRLDDGLVTDHDIDGEDGSTPGDAFDAIGRSIHERRKRA